MRIPIGNRDDTQESSGMNRETNASADDTSSAPGGDITPEQDAGAALDEVTSTRVQEVETWGEQAAGETEQQTTHLKPSPANPGEGLPPNPYGKENTGGANPLGDGGEDDPIAAAHSEWNEKYLRLAADFENFKRQAQRREAEVRERTVRNIFEDLLPVLDNFERAVQAAQNASDVTSLRVGVEYILKQLHESLRAHGVEPMETRGQKFDPLHHEALEEVPGSGEAPGTVIEEAQRGYSFKGQVLRPARVRVAG